MGRALGRPRGAQPGCLDLWRRWLDQGFRLAATGATDAHRHEDWQGAVPLTDVQADSPALDAVLAALRAGRTYVSSGPSLGLDVRHADGRTAGIGDSVERAQEIDAWCAGAGDADLRIVVGGETRAQARVSGDGRVSAPPRPGDGCCCAELWRGPVLLAVTSPIYLDGR